MRAQPAPGSTPRDAANMLSDLGEHYLAGLLAHALHAAQTGRERARDSAVGIVGRRIGPVQGHVDAREILETPQIEVGPFEDGTALAGALDAWEEADRIVEQRRGVRVGEELGAGERLFGESSDKKPMRLVDSQTIDGDVAYLTYEAVRDA